MSAALAGKTCFVTGGGSGIGRATALAIGAAGGQVVIFDRDAAQGEAVLAELHAARVPAICVPGDVTSDADIEAAIATTVAHFGRLDCAFNNAGIEGAHARLIDYDEAEFTKVMTVNVTGVFLCMRRQIPAMLRTGGGAIVNTASITGLVGWRGAPAYAASKHAVIGLTRSAALECARQGIRVNAVCPGVIETPMGMRVLDENPQAREVITARHPMRRLGAPDEVAAAVVWLLSDAASFTTGHALTMDGGLVAQ